MDQARRLFSFFFISLFILVSWQIIGPKVFPNWNWGQNQEKQQAAADAQDADKKDDAAKDPVKPKDNGDANKGDADVAKADKDDKEPPQPQEPQFDLPTHADQTIVIGSPDRDSDYALAVELTSLGASVRSALLNRYKISENPDHIDPTPQLRILGNNLGLDEKSSDARDLGKKLSFDVGFPAIDNVFKAIDETVTTRNIAWEMIEPKNAVAGTTYSSVLFRLKSPDGTIEFDKRFSVSKAEKEVEKDSGRYMLDVELTVRNTGKKNRNVNYTLQGPVGLPLENSDTTRFFRSVQAGFLSDDGDFSAETLSASEIVGAETDDEIEEWSSPVRYMGVDVQYFSALIFLEKQLKNQDFATISPMVIDKEQTKEWSDISVLLHSQPTNLKKGASNTQTFRVYIGPKDYDLLASLGADETINFGWFSSIGHLMIALLQIFHGWNLPYGVTIILLTCVVRGLMFPISKKQALSQKRMKELQPEIAALREKYKDDKQKMAQAQMELYRKANFNPFAGCLPLILQLPIFVALYNTVGSWVDLRMATFLWIDNLAAPDGLIEFGQDVWLIGSRFNLLPVLTILLFYLQQKMFMPPPSSPEMASQQKMMNFMLIIFLFLFYHMPAGLCVYFVASSMWGMGERKLLDILPPPPPKPKKVKKEGYFGKLIKKMQEAADMQQRLKGDDDDDDNSSPVGGGSNRGGGPNRGGGGSNKGKKNKKKKR